MSYAGTIATRSDFNAALERTEDGQSILIIWVYAVWCGESKQVRPAIDALTQTLGADKGVFWYKMDIEKATRVCDEYGISDTPIFMVFKEGDMLPETKVMGVAADRLKREIEKVRESLMVKEAT